MASPTKNPHATSATGPADAATARAAGATSQPSTGSRAGDAYEAALAVASEDPRVVALADELRKLPWLTIAARIRRLEGRLADVEEALRHDRP